MFVRHHPRFSRCSPYYVWRYEDSNIKLGWTHQFDSCTLYQIPQSNFLNTSDRDSYHQSSFPACSEALIPILGPRCDPGPSLFLSSVLLSFSLSSSSELITIVWFEDGFLTIVRFFGRDFSCSHFFPSQSQPSMSSGDTVRLQWWVRIQLHPLMSLFILKCSHNLRYLLWLLSGSCFFDMDAFVLRQDNMTLSESNTLGHQVISQSKIVHYVLPSFRENFASLKEESVPRVDTMEQKFRPTVIQYSRPSSIDEHAWLKEVRDLLILPMTQRTRGKKIRHDFREYRLEDIGLPLLWWQIDGLIRNVFVYRV